MSVRLLVMADDRCDVLCLDLPKAEALRQKSLAAAAAGAAAARARALADPTRLSLASSLRDGDELCVCDLAWISGRSQNLVSHHLRVLKQEGLAASRREGKVVFYSLTDGGAELLDTVLAATAASPAGIEGVR
jgi:ArsR family transcriptional regulator, lead/cadmium/zinc/bismuth-responsive transcriptional repressor